MKDVRSVYQTPFPKLPMIIQPITNESMFRMFENN